MSATETPRRPTGAELVREVAVAALSRTSTPPEHSVTISRNARGVVQFEVTVRGYDLDDVRHDARKAYVALEEEFPYPAAAVNGGTE